MRKACRFTNITSTQHKRDVVQTTISVMAILSACTAISKGCHTVNSRYWNQNELWDSSSTNNLLLLSNDFA